jgi:hypothetical protein
MSLDQALDDDAFFSTYYHDPARQQERLTVYFQDGRVLYDEGAGRQEIFRFSAQEVAEVMRLLVSCGLPAATDLPPVQAYDTARVVWRWRLQGREGVLRNPAYPAVKHPVMECVSLPLWELEQAAQDRDNPLPE